MNNNMENEMYSRFIWWLIGILGAASCVTLRAREREKNWVAVEELSLSHGRKEALLFAR